MSREIKFRAWLGASKEMISHDEILYGEAIQNHNEKSAGIYDITLMQFTGLHDKNGKEIYDGDIISMHQFIQVLGEKMGVCESEQELKGSISIEEMGIFFNCTNNDDNLTAYLLFFNLHEESLEVIGNIYENHELLK